LQIVSAETRIGRQDSGSEKSELVINEFKNLY